MLGSSSMANIVRPVDPRAVSKQRKKDRKKVKVQERIIYNAHKREYRLNTKLGEKEKVMTPLRWFNEMSEESIADDRHSGIESRFVGVKGGRA